MQRCFLKILFNDLNCIGDAVMCEDLIERTDGVG